MNHSTPGLPVHHQLPEFTQTHVHRVGDAIQPSHPLSSPSPPAPNPSQNQSPFQWVNSSHQVAKVLELQLQHHSFQRNPRVDLLQNGLVGSQIDSVSLVHLKANTDVLDWFLTLLQTTYSGLAAFHFVAPTVSNIASRFTMLTFLKLKENYKMQYQM